MRISVCMATYNGEKYIKEQLESILYQLGEFDEVIVSDDGSIDNTIDIIDSFQDPRITILRGKVFASPVYNFENALKHASGEIIILSDQDDVWMSDKVNKIKKTLHQADLVISDALVVDEHLKVIHESFYELNGSRVGLFNNLIKNSYLGCAMAFNREIVNKILPFPKGLPMHDWWIGLVAEKYGKVCFLPEKLIMYRRHGGNASDAAEKSKHSLMKKLFFRLQVFFYLLSR